MALVDVIPYQFKPGESGNPSGRPKGLLTKEIIKRIFDELAALSVKELRDFVQDENQSAIRIQIAASLLNAIESREHSKIDTLMNRSIGKVEDKLTISKLTNDELAAEADRRLELEDGSSPTVISQIP